MASCVESMVLLRKYPGLAAGHGDPMSYSVLKLMEFTLDYLLRNELEINEEIPEGPEARAVIVAFVKRKISECKAEAARIQ
jgi:hypothetical protein